MALKDKMDLKDNYLLKFKGFESSLNGKSTIPFHAMRQEAIKNFRDIGFPTLRDEEWKYTNVAPIIEQDFDRSTIEIEIDAAQISNFTYKDQTGNTIVFVNGQYSDKLSDIKITSKDVIIESLQSAFENHASIIEKHLAKYATKENNAFTALNTAFVDEGVLIYLPKDVVIEEPIHLLFLSDGRESFVAHQRILVVLEKGAQATIIESYHHLSDFIYFNNVVTEIVLGENANLKHYRLQDESEEAFNINTIEVHQRKKSVYSAYSYDIGGSIIRNNINVLLGDIYCETNLYGLFLGHGKQLIDNHTTIDHAQPHCISNELYKGILDDKARGIFNGKVHVRQDAQKTNAFQENKNLLLSDDATINTKPQLEIFADDVKCSHGATIGQLDEEALFYLRTRGIDFDQAKSILRFAFANDLIDKIDIEPLRKRIKALMLDRFKRSEKEVII
ncbi:Fe-S cluster assembly protein SufD [Candidatus Amoebophilus asiaticus]|nr:Fe-S cluster assembly protein SufD [Candidatus Amoebophilus asiaticus]